MGYKFYYDQEETYNKLIFLSFSFNRYNINVLASSNRCYGSNVQLMDYIKDRDILHPIPLHLTPSLT